MKYHHYHCLTLYFLAPPSYLILLTDTFKLGTQANLELGDLTIPIFNV